MPPAPCPRFYVVKCSGQHLLFPIVATAFLLVAASGCAWSGLTRATEYPAQPEVLVGSVIDFHPVVIEPRVAGNGNTRPADGRTSGELLAAISGGALGAVAGREVDEMRYREEGYEIFVQLETGQVLSVVQPSRIYEPRIGDPVIIVGERVRYNPAYL